jgi:hypothetical protein
MSDEQAKGPLAGLRVIEFQSNDSSCHVSGRRQ